MTRLTRRAALALTTAVIAGAVQADATYLDGMGYALKGYDPVTYWTLEIARKGNIDYEYEDENDVTWLFSSEKNLELFKEDPEKYRPQYGGFDAQAVARGFLRPGNPTVFVIVKDKLYLHYSVEVQNGWAEDIIGNIAEADANWPDLSETYDD